MPHQTVCHFTTVHSRTDTRICIKQTAWLAKHAIANVLFLVQDGHGGEKDGSSGVEVINTGPKSCNRLARMTLGGLRMLRAVRQVRPTVAHFHDPELIPVGLVLKLGGCRVIYDVHEDVPQQILGKYYMPLLVRKPVAWSMEAVERIAGRCFDAIVPATPKIAERFRGEKTVVVQNFPILGELVAPVPNAYDLRPPCFAYVGGITSARGVREMVKAIRRMPCREARLRLAGAFYPEGLLSKIKTLPGWGRVDFLGWADRQQVAKLLGSVRAGLVVLHPTKRYPDAYPVKMFEYMAAGIPVIASDFPLWREIVDGAGCGLLVDPMDPDAIAKAMQWILAHPADAEAMGRRGRQAVVKIYNWEREAKKLIKLYVRLLNQD